MAGQYARAVLRLGRHYPFDLNDQVNARIERQRALERDTPPIFHAIMDEAVIIQIIPFGVGAHAGFAGPIVLAGFDGSEVAYVDNALRGDVIEKADDLAAIRRLWQLLSSNALPEQSSIELIREVAGSWRN